MPSGEHDDDNERLVRVSFGGSDWAEMADCSWFSELCGTRGNPWLNS